MKLIYIFIGVLFMVSFQGTAQKSSLTDTIPLNPKVRQGVLPNGLQYYILKSDQPGNKISMRLIVNVGFPDENPNQANMAHLIEHLAFRSTENFPMGVRDYFKGLTTVVDLGASTNWTTNYYMNIQTNDSVLVHKGLLALYDWAGGISFLPEEVEEERSAVYREFSNADNPAFLSPEDLRYRQLDSNQMYKPALHKQMQNAITAPLEVLLQVYRDWYHPMYQCVIIVGNVDEKNMEQQVKKLFSDLTNTGAKKKKNLQKLYDVPLYGKDRLLIANRGAGSSEIEIEIYKKQKSSGNTGRSATRSDYKAGLMDDLVNEMMKHRRQTKKNAATANPTFLIERNAIHTAARIEAIQAFVSVSEPQGIKPAILHIFKEMKRLDLHGFSGAEFIRAKEILTAVLQQQASLADATNRLVSHYVTGEAFPANEEKLKTQLLAQITLKEVNAMVKTWLRTKGNTDIVLKVSGENSPELPTEQQALSWMREALKSKVSPYAEPVVKPLPLISGGADLKDCTVTTLDGLKAIKVLLPNGATVILKTIASGNQNSIVLQGLSRRAHPNLVKDEELIALLKNVHRFTGIGPLNVADLKLWKQEKGNASLEVYPYIRSGEAGIEGRGNAEALMQLVNLYITQGVADEEAFKESTQRINEENASKKSPVVAFMDTIQATINHRSSLQPSVSSDRSKLDEVFRIYKKQFENAADFTFVIIGSYNTEEMLSLVAHYIGALPGSKASIATKIEESSPTKKSNKLLEMSKPVVMMGDSVGNVHIHMLFRGECELNTKNKLVLDVMTSVLNSILFQRLREKEKGVYGVLAGVRVGGYPNEFFQDINFETAPEDVDRLMAAVTDELNKLAKGQLEEGVFTNAVANVRSRISYEMKNPGFSANYIAESVRNDTENADRFDHLEILDALTLVDVTNAVRDYLNIKEYKLFKLL